MERLLEICVDSLASARSAIRGGADRLELCSSLALGGLTPYTQLLKQIRSESDIPIRCLIRPRAGDFLYDQSEIQQMAMQIEDLKDAGADGFVIGCLDANGYLDNDAMTPLLDASAGCGITLHRCIDVSNNPVQTYLDAKKLGFDTILTSGAAGNCMSGLDTIKKLLELQVRDHGPNVLIGAGVNASVIRRIRTQLSNAQQFHMSGKTEIESRMVFRREGVPMGIPGMDEWHISQTSEAFVAAAKAALHE